MTAAYVAVTLTPPQRDAVSWAADAMGDYWSDHEGRDEPESTNIDNPVRMTPDGCEVFNRADVLDDLRYRLVEQLPEMAESEQDTIGLRSQLAAAARAYERVQKAFAATNGTAVDA